MILEGNRQWNGEKAILISSAKWKKALAPLFLLSLYPFLSANHPLLTPTKQVNLHKGDGLINVLKSFLVDDINILLILWGVTSQWGNGWIATGPRPDLYSLPVPRGPIGQRPTQSHVHSWETDTGRMRHKWDYRNTQTTDSLAKTYEREPLVPMYVLSYCAAHLRGWWSRGLPLSGGPQQPQQGPQECGQRSDSPQARTRHHHNSSALSGSGSGSYYCCGRWWQCCRPPSLLAMNKRLSDRLLLHLCAS